MKIVTVVGARPQFIKLSPVSRALKSEGHQEYLIHTGQHYDREMSKLFFEELELPEPNINLGIGSGTHAEQTAGMLIGIEKVLLEQKPNLLLIYGDTNSTLAGALAAVKIHIPVAHIEAGLRSFNRRMPEEINRIVADSISEFLFTPTKEAVENLRREGVPEAKIHQVGDVMFDTTLLYSNKAAQKSQILNLLGLTPYKYILATIHRAENTDSFESLSLILKALSIISNDIPVVLPLHPRTRNILEKSNLLELIRPHNIQFIEPVGYLDMIQLEKNATLITTDSGGVQKEAFFHQIPCVTLRNETEWVELVDMGWNSLCPIDTVDAIISRIKSRIGTKGQEGTPYGAGHAAEMISRILSNIPV